ncbi:GNAT family N-acetyltransferase [Streptomyces sp. SCA3-4]|uniref:GNAT family N-acetyltransferase n=1 Tax=Streptomyces sichuanensis TaxID=2871810 RepID=UPI001CE3547E|nr:GNAT family N-acetyltransferase [Streptomyces sichuanensis]MCA6091636.1 GNAT family N-acetyltransferase [Streptomyces sichuanensis]
MTDALASWTITPQPVGSAESAALLREYLTDVADRWYLLHHGRRCTPEEIERHLAEDPSDDLAPPDGVLLVARHGGERAAGGCVGLRRLDGGTAELTRMYLRAGRRGLGGAEALMAAAESTARAWGAGRIVLNTRGDLVEARRLYARHGFTGIPAYDAHRPYADVWLGKTLAADRAAGGAAVG